MKLLGKCATLLAVVGPVSAALASAEGDADIFAGGLTNIIVTLVVFGIVVYILGKYAWPPLLKTLDDRERSIRTALEDAKREREEAARLMAEYQTQLNQAREQATAIVEEGRRDAEVVRRRIQDEAQTEAGHMIERAKREIGLATDAAVKQLYDQTADLAANIASQIVSRELKPDDHRGLVKESLDRMKASRN